MKTLKNLLHPFLFLVCIMGCLSNCRIISTGISDGVSQGLDSSKYKVRYVLDSAMMGIRPHTKPLGDSIMTGAALALDRVLKDSLTNTLRIQLKIIIDSVFEQSNREAAALMKKLGKEGNDQLMIIRDNLFNEKLSIELIKLRDKLLSPDLDIRLKTLVSNGISGVPDDFLQKLLRNALLELKNDTTIANLRNDLIGNKTKGLLDTMIIDLMKTLNKSYKNGIGNSVESSITGIGRFVAENLYIVAGVILLIFLLSAWILNWFLKKRHMKELEEIKSQQTTTVSSENLQDVLEALIRKVMKEKLNP
jgi:hypothetical protein